MADFGAVGVQTFVSLKVKHKQTNKHTDTHTDRQTQTHTQTHTDTHRHTHARTQCMHAHIHIHTHVCTRARTRARARTHTHTHTHTHARPRAREQTHTHAHTHTQRLTTGHKYIDAFQTHVPTNVPELRTKTRDFSRFLQWLIGQVPVLSKWFMVFTIGMVFIRSVTTCNECIHFQTFKSMSHTIT